MVLKLKKLSIFIRKMGDSLYNLFTKTTDKPLKKLSELDRVIYKIFLPSLKVDDYKRIPGET